MVIGQIIAAQGLLTPEFRPDFGKSWDAVRVILTA
jgi:hypothetical protein